MNILNIIGANIALLLIGYLIGSFCFGVILSKLLFHQDVRNYGSKSCGATNINRKFGFKWAIVVWIFDLLKIVIASIIAYFLITKVFWFGNNGIYLVAGFGGLLGHTFPIYFRFKGGKIVSSFMGLLLSYSLFLLLLGLFFFVVVWLIFKKIGKSSVIFAIVILISCWFPWFTKSGYWFINYYFSQSQYYLNYPDYYANTTLITIGAILLIALHHQNIKNEFIIVQKWISYRQNKLILKKEKMNIKKR